MPRLVEFEAVKKHSKNLKVLDDLYQIRLIRIEADDLTRYLARLDHISYPREGIDEDAYYRYENETIYLPARTRAQVAVHEYAHHRTWVKTERRNPESKLTIHGPEFVRNLDTSARRAWKYLTGEK